MRQVLLTAAVAIAALSAQAAAASSLVVLPRSLGTVGAATLTFGEDAKGDDSSAIRSKAWVLDDRMTDGSRSYLLRYNRGGIAFGGAGAQGAIQFSTLDNEALEPSFADPLTAAPDESDEAEFVVTTSHLPEPAFWGMMIAGFGLIGLGLRRRPARAHQA